MQRKDALHRVVNSGANLSGRAVFVCYFDFRIYNSGFDHRKSQEPFGLLGVVQKMTPRKRDNGIFRSRTFSRGQHTLHKIIHQLTDLMVCLGWVGRGQSQGSSLNI